ncbi:MAG: hypothetical protein E2602_19190 [Achromobacter sp.]|nr:hypothetical protein [Achromobacter sp.]
MNSDLRLRYQRQLIYAGLDDFTPNGVFPTYLGGRDGHNVAEWKREVVAFLKVSTQRGAVKIVNWNNLFSSLEPVNLDNLMSADEKKGNAGLDEDIVWNSLYFFGTDSLIKDLERFGLLDWDALMLPERVDFINFIQDKYRIVFS